MIPLWQDRAGRSWEILEQFATRRVNLSALNRPASHLGDYFFSVDVDGHIQDDRVADALMGVRRMCPRDSLGSYPRAISESSRSPSSTLMPHLFRPDLGSIAERTIATMEIEGWSQTLTAGPLLWIAAAAIAVLLVLIIKFRVTRFLHSSLFPH